MTLECCSFYHSILNSVTVPEVTALHDSPVLTPPLHFLKSAYNFSSKWILFLFLCHSAIGIYIFFLTAASFHTEESLEHRC